MARIRKSIALSLALVVAVLTLGRIRVNWTGEPTASGGGADGRGAVARSLGPQERPYGRGHA